MVNTNTNTRKKYRLKKINQSKKNRNSLRRKTVRSNTKQRRLNSNSKNKVKCCMCDKNVDIRGTLIPSICLRQHGIKAHRICSKCWWNRKKGFAREDAPHHCSGCEKKMPFTFSEKNNNKKSHSDKEPIVIDLTSDSDDN